jgi:hypothetical protein
LCQARRCVPQVVGYLDYPTLEDLKQDGEKAKPAGKGATHCMNCSGGAGHAEDDTAACKRRAEMAQQRAITAKA